jgi:hypothetical protein
MRRVSLSSPGPGWIPDRWVIASLIAAPREIRLDGGLCRAERDVTPGYGGPQIESAVAVGYRIPIVRRLAGGDRWPDDSGHGGEISELTDE